jgi:hypothetical protein
MGENKGESCVNGEKLNLWVVAIPSAFPYPFAPCTANQEVNKKPCYEVSVHVRYYREV